MNIFYIQKRMGLFDCVPVYIHAGNVVCLYNYVSSTFSGYTEHTHLQRCGHMLTIVSGLSLISGVFPML